MASATPVCSLCELLSITKPSITWCITCGTGLCSECQEHHSSSKKTRNHKTVPITDYQQLPTDILKISEYCEKHNEKFTVYCKNHACPCCSICIIEDHCECGDLAKLADVTKNIKSSDAFSDIKHLFANLADNIKKVQLNRENNLKRIYKMRGKIEKEIKQTRNSINNHLDKIQTDIMKQLVSLEEKESKHIDTLLILLKDKENEINEFQKNIVKIKKYATDLQTFLHMKQLEDEVSVRENFLELMADKEQFQDRDLSYHATAAIHKFVKDIHSFGVVTIATKTSHIDLKRKKNKQVHIQVPHSLSKSVNSIKLKRKLTVDSTGEDTRGCCLLPDGRMAFPNYHNHIVRVFDTNGRTFFDVKTDTYALDIAYFSENVLAVTSGASRTQSISLLDIKCKRKTNIEAISVHKFYYGIAVKDTDIICSAYEQGIQLISCSATGKEIQSIKKSAKSPINIVLENVPDGGYVATFAENIYHTNHQTHCVTCYNFLKRKVQWKFKNTCVLQEPRGISVDNDGNVFVVGNASNNVVVISAKHKEILKASDGLLSPYTLDCHRSANELLVANDSGKAMLFTIDY